MQLREKNLTHDEFLSEAKEIKKLCNAYNVPLIINDDVDIAIESGADGVHVGQKDMDVSEARRKLGADKIIGVSARTVEQALLAEKNGADYLGVGAVFSTSTKLDAKNISHETLRDICSAVSIPVVAIGGISKDNITQLAGTGVDGVALVSAVFSAKDIEKECVCLRSLSESMVNGR